MADAFAIEDLSWKGENGSSILKTPGMDCYMAAEAQVVARAGMLDLWFLYLDGKPIAFEYCHFAKGVCYSHKIGYDPAYRNIGPGRVLKYYQLQQYHQDPDCQLLDTLGFFCESKAKWATRTYPVGRMYASIGKPVSNLLVQGYAWLRPLVAKLRRQTAREVFPQPCAAGYLDAGPATAS